MLFLLVQLLLEHAAFVLHFNQPYFIVEEFVMSRAQFLDALHQLDVDGHLVLERIRIPLV